jgi:ABC-type multidrug transport system ATPase subunit
VIRINNLSKRFGQTAAVDGVSLEIPAGDAVALWGSNGAGKTTIIRCVLGLLRFKGQIEVAGRDVRRHGKRARSLIGYVPQELGFYDDLGVAQAVTFFARLKGVRVASVAAVLGRVGLSGHERKRIRELSGGMKQRLALAIAMLDDPPVLILDEVTASLDACGREEFVSLLSSLSAAGKTMLFASHRAEEVATLARRVVLLDKGRVRAEIPAPEFIPYLGLNTVLHLRIEPGARQRAVELLSRSGFSPRLNGVGIYVNVPAEQKAAPFRVLAEGCIRVEDFQTHALTAADHEGAHP